MATAEEVYNALIEIYPCKHGKEANLWNTKNR
jgi:hypothetical protein